MDGPIQMYNNIIEDLKGIKPLSQILPSALILSKQLKIQELGKWIELEMNSYFNSNAALTKEVRVPEYRIVPGQYFDINGRIFIIEDPNLKFVNEYRLRNGVQELEDFSRKETLLTINDPSFTELIKNHFNVEVYAFRFSSTSVIGILTGIRTNLINRLMAVEVVIEKDVLNNNGQEHTVTYRMIENLHPSIQDVALKLYIDGHYRQAILDTYILLTNSVKTKSGRHDLDGVQLVQTVFSPKNPCIKISDNIDEQQGFMWLFSGAIMGIRNPNAHNLIEHKDPQKTLEWITYASALLRTLDGAEVLKPDK